MNQAEPNYSKQVQLGLLGNIHRGGYIIQFLVGLKLKILQSQTAGLLAESKARRRWGFSG